MTRLSPPCPPLGTRHLCPVHLSGTGSLPVTLAHFAHLLQEASLDPPEVWVGFPGTVVTLSDLLSHVLSAPGKAECCVSTCVGPKQML